MVREAQLKLGEHGAAPADAGWFVLNARDAAWVGGPFGAWTGFEGAERFPKLGFNVTVLAPGEPNCFYHAENEQEDFLVIEGECLLIVEGEERTLRRWDFVHCPPWTEHVFVGAGETPCVVIGVGSRSGGGVVYPVSEPARGRGAGVAEQTDDPEVAYASTAADRPVAFDPRWLPGG